MGISTEEQVKAEPTDLEWVSRFITSLEQGNVDHVLSLLSEDVMLVADGGGKITAFKHPVQTRDQVAHILAMTLSSAKTIYQSNIHFEVAPLNGGTGILLRSMDEIVATMFIHLHCGKLARIYVVRNPDKLTRI
ncbi:hypothetical protein [Lentibacillus halodurans]|nr:hypothetical protein [Lentibacillus halodurans]